jgi:alkanesulfonate monooxygenase SsuD/methylene tetrahydromethanopterin reductase-like flavin-dependent oxidoreductase (luciferase family)
VIAACIRLLRPHVEVSTTGPEGLEWKAASLDPLLIVSSRPRKAIPLPPIAWITIPTEEPTKPTEVWQGEDRWEAAESEANVVGLLERVIDRAEEELAAAGDPNAPLARPDRSESNNGFFGRRRP